MIERGPTTALPQRCAELMCRLAEEGRLEAFEIFGGAAFDLLRGQRDPPDIDVAVRGDASSAVEQQTALTGNPAFGDVTPVREYWIHLRRKIWVFRATWRPHVLVDVSVMDHTNEAHFDVETVMWHFPELVYTDPFRALDIEPGVRLVPAVTAENPLLLINRALKVSAKYGHPTQEAEILRILSSLADQAATWWPDDAFHGRSAHDRFLRHLPEAALRSERPAWLLDLCHRSGVLAARLPALATRAAEASGIISQMASQTTAESFWATADAIVGLPAAQWRDYDAARHDASQT